MDIPVPHGRGRVGGGRLLGLHPGQSSTAFGDADHRFPAATAEQIVDIPVPRGGRDLLSAASSSGLPGMAHQGFFSHFSPWEKVRSWVRTRGRNCSPGGISLNPRKWYLLGAGLDVDIVWEGARLGFLGSDIG